MSELSNVPQTPYAVALRLAEIIAFGEGKVLRTTGTTPDGVDKEYVLGLYRDCLAAVGSKGSLFSPRG